MQEANIKASANGHYLFFDVTIVESTKVWKYNFKIQTASGFFDNTKSAEVFFVSMIKSFSASTVLTDGLKTLADVKISDGKLNFTMSSRTAGIYGEII